MEHYRGLRLFVTGGSSGIGKAVARLASSWGAHVAIAARGPKRLTAALEEIRNAASDRDQRFAAFPLDVGDREAVHAIAPRVLESLDGLDLLVNDAGISHPGHVLEIPDAVFETTLRTNYLGVVQVTRAFLPHFLAQKSGWIANVSSAAGFVGIYGYTAYSASKFAVAGFSECLRQELRPHGIGVTVVFPADTDTPQLEAENLIKPEETRAIAGTIRPGSPEAVARALLAGVAAGRFRVVPGFMNRVTWYATRLAPGFVRWITDRDVDRVRRAVRGPNARGSG
ncbi:MAG: SDR family oxidoreductase [Deltaproteobacteria bacterium]|nr:SDR family oxidoreductase [Deltaproteobacteria bacterium]